MRLFIPKRPPFRDIFFAKRRNKGLAGSYRKDILFKRYVSLSCTVSCTVCRSSDSHVQRDLPQRCYLAFSGFPNDLLSQKR